MRGAAVERGDRRGIGAAAGGEAVGGLEIGEAVVAEPAAELRPRSGGTAAGPAAVATSARDIAARPRLRPAWTGLIRSTASRWAASEGASAAASRISRCALAARRELGIDIAHPIGRGRAMRRAHMIDIGAAQQQIGAGEKMRIAAARRRRAPRGARSGGRASRRVARPRGACAVPATQIGRKPRSR